MVIPVLLYGTHRPTVHPIWPFTKWKGNFKSFMCYRQNAASRRSTAQTKDGQCRAYWPPTCYVVSQCGHFSRFRRKILCLFSGVSYKSKEPIYLSAIMAYTYVSIYVKHIYIYMVYIYTGCNRRNVRDFGRVFLMLNYTDIAQNTYIQSWTVTEIMAIEMCGLLGV